jgi:hypothetical protein
MDNPNEYDDEKWSTASMRLISAVQAAWEAGASLDNIGQDVQTGLENAGAEDVMVEVMAP